MEGVRGPRLCLHCVAGQYHAPEDMRYDLEIVSELCSELGLRVLRSGPSEVAIELEECVVLLIHNAEDEQDCLIGFEGTEWHFHDQFGWSDRLLGSSLWLDYLDVISGLADGTILICEHWSRGSLKERWLVHRDDVDEFQYMEAGDEIRIRRIEPRP